jgi:hypothetical protein
MPEAQLGTRTLTVTAWFGPPSHPAHEGVYERRAPAGPFACWNGRAWNADARSPAHAAAQRDVSPHQDASWRGLVEPSDVPCATCRGHTVVDRGVDDENGIDLIAECPDC